LGARHSKAQRDRRLERTIAGVETGPEGLSARFVITSSPTLARPAENGVAFSNKRGRASSEYQQGKAR
jgi:hypothetical protein